MDDPFIVAHETLSGCFDLSGRYHPVSIRDQMLRSYYLVERLFDRGRLKEGTRILVVGAGIAGVMAGIRAAAHGAKVVIVEKTAAPFALQREVHQRWISPTLYDWPLPHWREGNFPRDDPKRIPMYWRAGWASWVAADWMLQLVAEQSRFGDRLSIRYLAEFRSVLEAVTREPAKSLKVEIASLDTRRISVETFDAALFCHGFGDEKTVIGDYEGPPFWSRGHEPGKNARRWLIMGGGDGALQEFLLRAAGGLSAGKIYVTAVPKDLRAGIERDLQSAEDQAHRAGLWAGPQHNHAIYASLERVHKDRVAKLLEDPRVGKNLDRRLQLSSPDSPARFVVIAHTCSHFGLAYALNRFLAVLIVRHLESRGMSPRRMNVLATDHKWAWTASKTHRVKFQVKACGEDSGEESDDEFDEVIVRAGVEPPPGIKVSFASTGGRQSLPYSLF